MLTDFFLHLREQRVPVTITEYLALLEALEAGLANCSLDDFYALSRLCLVKNEAHYDRFDLAFAKYFERLDRKGSDDEKTQKARLDSVMVGMMPADAPPPDILLPDNAMQMESHQPDEKTLPDEDNGKMTGSGGKGPPGVDGINPEGIRMDSAEPVGRKAWDSREFQALDDDVELGTRNIKIALRRLRKFAREGVPDELDLADTIRSTAKNAGWLDIVMRPERRNKVKVLLLFDTGGSMVPHVKRCEELFSAARAEFRHMDTFYFHNCVYETVWKYEGTALTTHYPLPWLINRFSGDYKLILVGDATMGPTEISDPNGNYGGSIYSGPSELSGETWMKVLLAHFRHAVWLNPEQERFWSLAQSIGMIRDIMENRMYPLTIRGLDDAMRRLGQ